MDEVTWFVPSEEDLKHDRIVMRHGDNERVYVPERKTGLWMDPEQMICWCSICGCRAEEVSNYCPDCGALMRPNWKKYKGEAQ